MDENVSFLKKCVIFLAALYRKGKYVVKVSIRFLIRTCKRIRRFVVRTAKKTGRFVVRTERKMGRFIIRTFKRMGRFVVRTAKKTSRFVTRTIKKTGRFIVRTAKKMGRFIIRTARKVKRFFVRLFRKIKRAFKRLFGAIRQPYRIKNWIQRRIKRFKQFGPEKRAIKIREKKHRKDFLETLLPILDAMPTSNGSKYYQKFDVKIAIVADEFLYDSFKDSAEFIYITPDNYKEYIEEVEFLFVASAWRGLNNEWRQMGTANTENNEKIHEVINAFKALGKTVVFYSKEDPPNYEHFLPIAQQCDIIFTTCAEKVDDYKRDCKNENVHTLEFCINPEFHNPIGMRNPNKKDAVFFAGSWMLKYPERVKSLEMMLDAVLCAGKELVIADRNFSRNNINYFFPAKYHEYTTKEIPHSYLQKVHKLYDWAVNINSITESKTMFANRVYELQANGCLMLSNRSVGVEEKFDEVIIVNNPEEVINVFDKYTKDDIYMHQITGVRRVMTDETGFDRVKKILDVVGYDVEVKKRSVLVIAEVLSDDVISMFEAQTYPNKKLIQMDDLTPEIYLKYDIVTRWNNISKYEKFYLEDMINAFKYTDCKYITKNSYIKAGQLVGNVEHDYVEHFDNYAATIFWRKDMDYAEFLKLNCGCDMSNGYSIDRFNYCQFD